MISAIWVAIMAILAVIDIKSTKTPKDFKLPIAALGILGAFAVVLAGLWGNDWHNTQDALPNAIAIAANALVVAMIGIGISVILAIYQRFSGRGAERKENPDSAMATKVDISQHAADSPATHAESEPLIAQNPSMDSTHSERIIALIEAGNAANAEQSAKILQLLESLNNHLQHLREETAIQSRDLRAYMTDSTQSINENIDAINTSIYATNELLESTHKFLKSNAKLINRALSMANQAFTKEIEKLSSDFTNDMVCQITALSKSFTDTINTHFSENFVRFNEAIENTLEWQKAYKQNITDSNVILSKTAKSIAILDRIIDNIISRDEETIRIYEEVSVIMKEYKAQHINLNERLASFEALNNELDKSAKQMGALFANLKKYAGELFHSLESSNNANKTLMQAMLESNKSVLENYHNLGKNLSSHTQAITQSASEMLGNLSKESIKSFKATTQAHFEDIGTTQSKVFETMNTQIRKHQETLNSSLSALMEHYLKSLEDITHTSLETSKGVSLAHIQDIQALNSEISRYIKDNAMSLNKSNMELLNIIEILQKQVEIAIEKNKTMQLDANASLKDIEDSLQTLSEGFKGDYEWFLRRIRDIIGQRL